MLPTLTREAWAQIRFDYEYSDRPIEEICAEHGISSGTLRDRMRRWGWTRRRTPIPADGPPALAPSVELAAQPGEGPALVQTAVPAHSRASGTPEPNAPSPNAALGPRFRGDEWENAAGEAADGAIAPRLQSALAGVLPAIEATVAKLAIGGMQPRQMEQAARALASLTRTLRELNGLLGQCQAAANEPDPSRPRDLDELRTVLARRMHAFVEERTRQRAATGSAPPEAAPEE
jgi:hypothetical protein